MTGIPARLVVGVTGHRRLEPGAELAAKIGRALEIVRGLAPLRENPSPGLTVLSSLAEGADRLVAERILEEPGAKLEAVLPLERDDYVRDFSGPGSTADFDRLAARSSAVHRLPPAPSRAEAYARAGRFVVDRCDVLIALWDGRPENGVGGTGEIVRYARERKRPIVWIDPAPGGEVRFEPGLRAGRRTP